MSHKVNYSASEYFAASKGYFWTWEDNGEVISSTQFQTTIVYREDITQVLKTLSHSFSPCLGSVLLVLYACSPSYKSFSYDQVKSLIKNAKDDDIVSSETLEYHIVKAFKLLNKIHQLPRDLRVGPKRGYLLTEVLNNNTLVVENLRDILQEFKSGKFDDVFDEKNDQISYSQVLADFKVLSEAESQFPSAEVLQEKLESGIVGLKEADLPILKKEFLGSLLEHKETAVLGDLANHIMSGVKIPMSFEDSGELSLGGVSDVTNKGEFDKLLLSELAYSDDLFLSRLINNEALYFKREVSSENFNKNRIIIVDTTIKTWGTPRVMALATALAFKYHPKSTINTKVFFLDDNFYVEKGVDTIEGVRDAIKMLSPALDPSVGLARLLESDEIKKEDEIIFLLESSNFYQEEVQKVFNTHRLLFDFIVQIHRNGCLDYHSVDNGILKGLGEVHLNIGDILNKKRTFGKTTRGNIEFHDLPFFPAFFQKAPDYPILSTLKEYPNSKDIIKLPHDQGVILKNRFNELVHFPKQNYDKSGGTILHTNIGNYHHKFALANSKEEVYLLTYTIKKLAGFSVIRLSDFSIEYFDLKEYITDTFKHIDVTVNGEDFTVRANGKYYCFNNKRMKLEILSNSILSKNTKHQMIYNIAVAETPFVKITNVSITDSTDLILNSKILNFDSSHPKGACHFYDIDTYKAYNGIKSVNYNITEKVVPFKKVIVFDNPKLKFRYVKFREGSEILFDNKGFAHFKSSESSIPEFSVKLSLNKQPSFYVDNTCIAAPEYMVNKKSQISVAKYSEVNELYLKPFLKNIIKAYSNGN